MLCGGFSGEKPMTDEVKDIVLPFRIAVEEQEGRTFEKFEPKTFTSQVVAGTNFLVKVDCGNGEYAQLKIFQPLPHTGEPPQLKEYTAKLAKGDALQ